MDDPASSPLFQIWPAVEIMLDDDVRSDVDQLLASLLPLAHDERQFRRGAVWFGAVVTDAGLLEPVKDGRSHAWRDEYALADRLDALVAAGEVRAVAQCERVTARESDGLHDWTYTAIRVLAEHRDGFSQDLVVPLDWAPIRRPEVRDPQAVDRIASGYPHRVWP